MFQARESFYCAYICRHKQKQRLILNAHNLIKQGVIDVTISQRKLEANLPYSFNFWEAFIDVI